MPPSVDDIKAAAGDREALASLFEPLTANAASRTRAWKLLAETCSRAVSGQSIKQGDRFYEREIRQLGPVVAWTEARVTVQRSLGRNGAVHLRVLDSTEDAHAFIVSELGAADLEWGYRPTDDELQDLASHRLARETILRAGDVSELDAYCERYGHPVLMGPDEERLTAVSAWTADKLVYEAVTAGASPQMLAHILAMQPNHYAVRGAATRAIQDGNEVLLALLLTHIEDVDEELFGDSLLAVAARERCLEGARALLARGASPNRVWSAFGRKPPFECAADDGNGPMVNAVRNGDAEMVRLLVDGGADPLAKTSANRRVIDMAKALDDAAVCAVLAEHIPATAAAPDMTTAVAIGDVPRVLELLATDGSEEALLACGNKEQLPVLEAVLASGQQHDPAVLSKSLWFASMHGYRTTVEHLLEHGADPNGFVHSLHGTARKIAQTNKRTDVAALLKKAGGKIRVKS